MPEQLNRKEELENGLMGFRFKYVIEYFKVQLAVLTGTLVIILGFISNFKPDKNMNLAKGAIFLIGIAILTPGTYTFNTSN